MAWLSLTCCEIEVTPGDLAEGPLDAGLDGLALFAVTLAFVILVEVN